MSSKTKHHGIQFERSWSMPNSDTFDIGPIQSLVTEEIERSDGLWLDPFSGGSNLADATNDLNPDIESDRTMRAAEFLQEYHD